MDRPQSCEAMNHQTLKCQLLPHPTDVRTDPACFLFTISYQFGKNEYGENLNLKFKVRNGIQWKTLSFSPSDDTHKPSECSLDSTWPEVSITGLFL